MFGVLLVFALAIAFRLCAAPLLADEPDVETQAGWKKLSESGTGLVVWESSRSGRWRIWRRDLDGANLRQLSPEEPSRDHLCSHISPDGTRLVYLSFPAGKQIHEEGKPADDVALHLIRVDGADDRVLIPSARSHSGGNRSAVWFDDQRLAYVDNRGITQELDLKSGKSAPLTAEGRKDHGVLINATKTHATEYPTVFLPYDPGKRSVVSRASLPGCEPYFTHDGRWGFWMGGAGGPINRFELATEQASPILNKNDPRMPKGRAYLYFPMVSRDGRFLAFGASPNQHDHSKSDYDIFVARLDPAKLELLDPPVRYTFDPATDRYPEVYVRLAAAGGE
jgi:hypothetical protein